MGRQALPVILSYCSAPELMKYLRRALREENVHEARMVFRELSRRKVKLPQADYWKLRRLKARG